MKPVSTIVSIILEVAKIAWGWECPGGLPMEVMFELSTEEGICINQVARGVYTYVIVHSCHLLFDHFQFALIHGPNIAGSYAILLFTASELASITSHIHTGYCFCFGSILSFFLELFLHWSLVAYWAPNDLGSSSFGILSFCLLVLLMGFSRQEHWSGLPFPSPVDHILSELF